MPRSSSAVGQVLTLIPQVQGTSESASSTTSGDQSSASSTSNYSATLIVIIALTLGLFVIIVIIVILYLRHQKSKVGTSKRHTTHTEMPTTVMTTIQDASTSTQMSPYDIASQTQTTWVGGNTTMFGEADELSIPSFLEKVFGVHFMKESVIAKGGGGAIYHCSVFDNEIKDRAGSSPVVFKEVGETMSSMPTSMQKAFYQELGLMWKLRSNPSFVKVFAYSVEPVGFVLKFYEFGDLYSFVRGKGRAAEMFAYTTARLVDIYSQYVKAIAVLHKQGIVHCDIKTQNVLLDVEDNRVMAIVTDFGISRVIVGETVKVDAFEVATLRGASPNYAAPEVWQEFKTKVMIAEGPKVKARDAYALSLTLFEMMTRRSPWRK